MAEKQHKRIMILAREFVVGRLRLFVANLCARAVTLLTVRGANCTVAKNRVLFGKSVAPANRVLDQIRVPTSGILRERERILKSMPHFN